MKRGFTVLFLVILCFSAFGENGTSETSKTSDDLFRFYSSREELKVLTGVPISGILIENLDQFIYDDKGTVVVVLCTPTEENAMKFFYDNTDHTVFFDVGEMAFVSFFEDILVSYEVSRDMVLTTTVTVLEITDRGLVKPYYSFCYKYISGEEIKYIVISLIPCLLKIDTGAVLAN